MLRISSRKLLLAVTLTAALATPAVRLHAARVSPNSVTGTNPEPEITGTNPEPESIIEKLMVLLHLA
jgi:hypothetical protein